MKMEHTLFSNSPLGRRDFTINFFYENAIGVQSALLACPFFSNANPLKILNEAGCRRTRLLIRLCGSTSPVALAAARELPNVQIRYFTSESFHAKFYILDNMALIGSANLTGAGMMSNRELSVVVSSASEWFDEIPSLFEELWDSAGVLTDHALSTFANWHRSLGGVKQEPAIDGVDKAAPETIKVGSGGVTRERTYLDTYRREYFEVLIPNYRIVADIFKSTNRRHPNLQSTSLRYEIDRFLSWVKLTFTTDETLLTNPIRLGADLRTNIESHIAKWFESSQSTDEDRLARLSRLRNIFATSENLQDIEFSSLTDSLLGVAAFDEQLRFTKGGKASLVQAFQKDNDSKRVRMNFDHLAFGTSDFVQRTYDCIYSADYRIAHFGRNCITELFGWINHEDVPPLNGRGIKALRYLGFDVPV